MATEQIQVSATQEGVTDWVEINDFTAPLVVLRDYLVIVEMDEDSALVDFEFTPDDPSQTIPSIIITHNILNNITTSCASTLSTSFQAFRLNVKTYKSGTITASVALQGRRFSKTLNRRGR